MPSFILALDQGTTSSRAILFDCAGKVVGMAQREFPQLYPQPGWVEHDPDSIWGSQVETARQVLAESGVHASSIITLGITNQRETTLVWDRETGRPIHNAIVWQDRRTADRCDHMRADGLEPLIRQKTGLLLDPYFSGTKLQWLLESVPGARARAERGELAFGTVDTFLLWKLTGGRVHATDVSNASRTMLFNIRSLAWDDELLELLRVPRAILPNVYPSSHIFGPTDSDLFGASISIAGVAGDQQAATFGQACFAPGSVKNTYGTGSFLLMNTGGQPHESKNRLLTTVGWGLEYWSNGVLEHGKPPEIATSEHDSVTPLLQHSNTPLLQYSNPSSIAYALEGSVFVTGAAIQWLRDELGIIHEAAETEALALHVPDSAGVYFVPAFAGLGAPYWDSRARGAIVGLTRGAGRAHIARAALEAACFQSRDVIEAMQADCGAPLTDLRVDGGMTANNALCQMQADILGIPVHRPEVIETTALGAAYLAGLATGIWSGTDEIARQWRVERTFEPAISTDERDMLYAGWKQAVQLVIGK